MIEIESLTFINDSLPIKFGHVDVYPAQKELPGFYEFRISYTKNSAFMKPITREIKLLPNDDQDIYEKVIKYFHTKYERTNPSFCYFLAVIFAKLMEQHFNVDFYEALDNRELFHGMFPFKPYHYDKELYDKIISSKEFKAMNKTGWVPFVFQIFEICFLRSSDEYDTYNNVILK